MEHVGQGQGSARRAQTTEFRDLRFGLCTLYFLCAVNVNVNANANPAN